MPWIRCPHGCIFEVEAHFLQSAQLQLVCPRCHRIGAFKDFLPAEGSRGVATVDNVARRVPLTPAQEVEEAVKARIRELMNDQLGIGSGYVLESSRARAVQTIYNEIVKLMMTAELTSNFPTSFLPLILKSGKLLNMWHITPKEKRQEKYAVERDIAERIAFHEFNEGLSREQGPDPLQRPFYTVLSVGNFVCGGAPNYGLSYVVCRDAIKVRCTYTATDTMQMAKQKGKGLGASDVYDYSALPSLLLRVTDNYLAFLANYAHGIRKPKVFEFLEAQAWGELDITRDVKAFVISETDLERFPTEASRGKEFIPPDWIPLSADERRAKVNDLKRILEGICAEFGIELYYLPLDGSTMNSMDARPPVPTLRASAVPPPRNGRWATIPPHERARIGLDRLERLQVGRKVWVLNANGDPIASAVIDWEAGTSMTLQFEDILDPNDVLFTSNNWWRNGLRYDKGSPTVVPQD